MTELFNGLTFVISAPRGEAKDVEQIIADNGGVNQKNVLAATKYVVIVGDGGAYRTKVDRANKLSVPIIKDSWLSKSVAAGKLLETDEFIWKESAEEEDKKEEETKTDDSESSSSSSGPRRSGRSRKAVPKMDDGADEEDEVAELPAVAKAKKRNAEEAELDESPVKKKVQRTDETTSTGSEPAFEEPVVKVTVTQKKGVANVDKFFKGPAGAEVYSEGGVCWHATLNQSDGTFGVKGHNKFFIIQLISKAGTFYVFTRWGRVGYDGSSKSQSFPSLDAAKRNFESKFADKTGNNWSNKANFEPYPKKYILIEMDFEGEDSPATSPASSPKKSSNISSALSPAVQDLMSLIFDVKMFDETLLSFEIDINRMPLGKISKSQIQKGYDILERMEKVLKGEEEESLSFLCNTFYSLIPHDFGFKKPPMIRSTEELQKKYDLLQTLGDIEVATQLMGKVNDAKHPLDVKYDSLDNEIEALEHDTDEWNRIITFLNNTAQYGQKFVVEEIYKIDRKGEKERFTKYDSLDNRKLLWHGSRVAVFASILNGGLKIMPHSGGRVGRGLYFADIISKSAAYCDYASNKPRLVLLNEVALGRIHTINRDDSSLVKAPPGFDSVLAEGKAMPDPSLDYSDYTLSHSGHPVIIPQGKVIKKPITSTFDHNEFLVYDSEQVRMRYLLKMRW